MGNRCNMGGKEDLAHALERDLSLGRADEVHR